MKVLCINDDFSSIPSPTRGAINGSIPKFNETLTISYQLVDDGIVWVEFEEIRGFMFDMEKHFVLLKEESIIN
jgi:hypothetical protein